MKSAGFVGVILLTLGLLAFVWGFGTEALRLDIPPQDPPPAVAQQYAREAAREAAQSRREAARFYAIARVSSLSGVLLLVVQGAIWMTKRAKTGND